MQLIRDNKNAEVNRRIFDLDAPVERHERMKKNSIKLRKLAVKVVAHQERREMIRAKKLEQMKKGLIGGMRAMINNKKS